MCSEMDPALCGVTIEVSAEAITTPDVPFNVSVGVYCSIPDSGYTLTTVDVFWEEGNATATSVGGGEWMQSIVFGTGAVNRTLTVTSHGTTATSNVYVTGPVVSPTVSQAAAFGYMVGQQVVFSLIAEDVNGIPVPGLVPEWLVTFPDGTFVTLPEAAAEGPGHMSAGLTLTQAGAHAFFGKIDGVVVGSSTTFEVDDAIFSDCVLRF